MTPPRILIAALLLLAVGCGSTDDAPRAEEPAPTAATTTEAEAAARVTYEYHDEFGHGHCSVTELAAEEEVVICIAPTDRGTRVACFTREEARTTRNALGLLRLSRSGEVEKQEAWPDECAEAFAVVGPGAGGGY